MKHPYAVWPGVLVYIFFRVASCALSPRPYFWWHLLLDLLGLLAVILLSEAFATYLDEME